MKFVDYYKILNVNLDDSSDIIKKSYHRLVKVYHPDENINKSAEEKAQNEAKLKEVSTAYEVLSDDLKRLEYDKIYYRHLRNEKKCEKLKKMNQETTNAKKVKTDFAKRHSNFEANINKNYTFSQNTFFANVEKTTLHTCAEILYQFNKLINSTAFKYAMENKLLIIATLACLISLTNIKGKEITPRTIINDSLYDLDNYKSYVDLTRLYEVKQGDTLEDLSKNTNVPVHMIKRINNKYSDDLSEGEIITLPYKIPNSELEYYTYSVPYDRNISLEEFALLYDTSASDLMALNEEAIILNNGTYIVLSDYLNVPNFITKDELAAKKDSKSLQKK